MRAIEALYLAHVVSHGLPERLPFAHDVDVFGVRDCAWGRFP